VRGSAPARLVWGMREMSRCRARRANKFAADSAYKAVSEQDARKTAKILDVRAQPAHSQTPNRASCSDNRQQNRQQIPPEIPPAGCFHPSRRGRRRAHERLNRNGRLGGTSPPLACRGGVTNRKAHRRPSAGGFRPSMAQVPPEKIRNGRLRGASPRRLPWGRSSCDSALRGPLPAYINGGGLGQP
jgi:hypothetical protein